MRKAIKEAFSSRPAKKTSTLQPPDFLHGWIRLLVLQPGTRSQPVNCLWEPARLSDRPYTAISYTWGAETKEKTISIDGRSRQVRANVHDLLVDVRSKENSRALWIDALCIDQTNRAERSAQVLMMGDIYSSANYVICWLSPDKGSFQCSPTYAARAIDTLYYRATENWAPTMLRETDLLAEGGLDGSLAAFFEHPYWSRRWIIQEIGLAKAVTVFCGPYSFPLAAIKALDNVRQRPWVDAGEDYFSLRTYQDSMACQLLDLQQSQYSTKSSAKLKDLLSQYEKSLCQDPKDKIYALLSLCTEARKKIVVNYAADLCTIMLSVLEYVCSAEALPPYDSIFFARSLMKQLGIDPMAFESSPGANISATNYFVKTPIYLLGQVMTTSVPARFEGIVHRARDSLRPVSKTGSVSFETMVEIRIPNRVCTASVRNTIVQKEIISPHDMYAFIITRSHNVSSVFAREMVALTTARVEQSDWVYIFANGVCVLCRGTIHLRPPQTCRVLGRVTLLEVARASVKGTPSSEWYPGIPEEMVQGWVMESIVLQSAGIHTMGLLVLAHRDP